MLLVTDPAAQGLDAQQRYWLYGANDCLGTRMCFDVLHPQLAGDDLRLYRAAFAFQAPCLAMTLRGTRIDEPVRRAAIVQCGTDEAAAIAALNSDPKLLEIWDVKGPRPTGDNCGLPEGVSRRRHNWIPRGGAPESQVCKSCGGGRLVGQAFNPHSPSQCAHLFYDLLGLKRRYSRKANENGQRVVTTDDEALEALANKYPEHAALVDHILKARGLRKQKSALDARLDPDGRWRSTFNVCAAETGRMSSSKSPYRTASNMQNISDKNRGIFTADPGLVMFYADLEAAESTLIAHDAQCPQDIEDHANGDAHTFLAKTLFPDLPWGSLPDRQVADMPTPWGGGSQSAIYRQIAKVTRHGTNIGMSDNGVARQLHVSRAIGKDMRARYFQRYPENLARQLEIRRTVRDTGVLVGPLGNTRRFLGRLWEDDVQREALAQIQQSTVAWMLNLAMWRVWNELDTRLNIRSTPRPGDPNRVWLLGQIHDAILGLVRPGDVDALRRVREIMETPIVVQGHLVRIRAEICVGTNWRHDQLVKVKL
jgi:DNA polymerase I-like protein with 3'-5' exonuclease and polymerase domains